jgi:hypothetical protein
MELYRHRIDGRSTTGKEASLARKIDEIERRLKPRRREPAYPAKFVTLRQRKGLQGD